VKYKIDSVVYFVQDVDAASKWYSGIFGCEVNYENKDYAFLVVDSAKVGFHREDNKNANSQSGQTVYWWVAKLSDAIEELRS
jgi:catechol 2,3-dioxygenase-like lactoylglutathione lyase family enzyme